jgi:hypothetical protein
MLGLPSLLGKTASSEREKRGPLVVIEVPRRHLKKQSSTLIHGAVQPFRDLIDNAVHVELAEHLGRIRSAMKPLIGCAVSMMVGAISLGRRNALHKRNCSLGAGRFRVDVLGHACSR